jgi:hypothetical protein
MVDRILVKHRGTFEYHHSEMVKQHVLEHVKVGEMRLEMEHVITGVMEFEMAHRNLKQKKMQQE